MVPLLLCSGLLLAPALASRINRQQPQDQAIGDTRLSVAAARPAGERASRSAPRPAVAGALAASTLAPPVPITSAPSTTTTTHHHHPVAKVAAVAKAVVPTSTTRPPRTTTTTKAPAPAPTKAPAPTTTTTAAPAYQNGQAGKASWYAAAAPGECAHRTIAKGTMVLVTNTANKRTVKCRVSDRGPYVDGRIIDLSQADFEQLAGSQQGVIDVFIQW